MANIPIYPGSSSFFPGLTPFGFYDYDIQFQADADKLVTYCARRLGYPLTDIELQDLNFYAAFEDAITIYGNEVYSSVAGSSQSSGMGLPPSCNATASQNPSDLLPKDTNSQWAQLNPAGKGDLANINLLKAGYHIGIDTIGQTLRNANLQIRSEPPNPQVNVGPWNLSTIEPDFMRPPLELGQGGQ